jgi:hypothetical protein
LGFSLGCFAVAFALAWWGPNLKPTFYLSLLLFMVGGVFVALLIQTLPAPYRQIAFGAFLILGAAVLGGLLLPVR